jgi:uncharacterized protein YprB with RNaseH-like and TPR domain
MALRDRLAALRRQSGAQLGEPALTSESSLAERIRRLRPGADRSQPLAARSEAQLARSLGGQMLAPGLVLIETSLGLQERHGRRPLHWLTEPPGDLPEARGLDPTGLLYLDTETTGLAGGTGTLVFLLGMARLEAGRLRLRQYLLTRLAGEAAMLEQGAAWLEQASALVTYNGRSFDGPLLSARFRLAGIADRLEGRAHLDLLPPVRRAFSAPWPDCRLATAEQRLLGLRRSGDLPGALAPQAWLAFLRQGNPDMLSGVVRHNRWDLLSLALLLPALDRAYRDPAAWGADLHAAARSYLRDGREDLALQMLDRHQARLDPLGLLTLARLLKRQGRWEQAAAIWARVAASGSSAASEQLAKYHEHVRRSYRDALECTARLPPGPERQRRQERLRHKLAATLCRPVRQR